jgi:RNA polymerase sigma-70 factor (ECF subfamily)
VSYRQRQVKNMSVGNIPDQMNNGAKDDRSFERIYAEYVRPVYYAAYAVLKHREDAEDVAHDVFLTWLGMEDAGQIRNIKDYLLRMAHNKALNLIRKRSREELTAEPEEAEGGFDSQPQAEDDGELTGQVEKAMLALPLEERQAFVLHVKAGLGFAEVARVMDMSLPSVYRRYKKAVGRLKESLKEVGIYG